MQRSVSQSCQCVTYWRKLPTHVRRGLLRLYVAISVPWVALFGYRIFDVLQRHQYGPMWRYVSNDFWLLLTVPIGGPLFFFATMWIFAGFRKVEADSHSRETLSTSKKNTSSEVEAVFEKLARLMDDERAQVFGLPEPFRSEVLQGADCDEIAGGVGEFGRNSRNPIPVNGPLGEVIYLSNLYTTSSQKIMFHRLGSINKIDVYETVSFDGLVWDVLFLDLYHPRKSKRAPFGYRIATGKDRQALLFGANEFVNVFPNELQDTLPNTYERLLGLRMRSPQVREAIERIKFKRPTAHQVKLDVIKAELDANPSRRSVPDFREAGRVMAIALMNPDDCWKDVCKLRGYAVPDSVATCELAFARAAIIRDVIKRYQPTPIATEMLAGVDKLALEAFANEDNPETLEHYENQRLSIVAPQVIRDYEENVFPLTQLADTLARRLSVPGWGAADITPLFEEVAAEAERLMRVSSLLTELR